MILLLRPVIALLLVLLPLQGWVQAAMAADTATAAQHAAAVPLHAGMPGSTTHMRQMLFDADIAEPMAAHDAGCATGGNDLQDSTSGCADHDHAHCVICHLAAAQPPAFTLLLANAAQHPCPQTANTAWYSADLRTLQRPPRV